MTPTKDADAAAPETPAVLFEYIAQCMELLDKIEAALPETKSFTSLDKKRRIKARKGNERHVPRLVALARRYGLALLPLKAIETQSAEALALVPLATRMERVNKRVQDRLFDARTSSWSGASKIYVMLKRLAKDESELATGLAPVEQFFNYRHPLVRRQHPKTAKRKAALQATKEAEEAKSTLPSGVGGGKPQPWPR
jgi:hypothetical protein